MYVSGLNAVNMDVVLYGIGFSFEFYLEKKNRSKNCFCKIKISNFFLKSFWKVRSYRDNYSNSIVNFQKSKVKIQFIERDS